MISDYDRMLKLKVVMVGRPWLQGLASNIGSEQIADW